MSTAVSEKTIRAIFDEVKTIALVGASNKPERASYRVMTFLLDQGFNVIPINPVLKDDKLLGQPVYPSLSAVSEAGLSIDMVDIFRSSEAALPVVEEAITLGSPVIWMQLGVVNEEAAQLAAASGCRVVMDRCPKIEFAKLI